MFAEESHSLGYLHRCNRIDADSEPMSEFSSEMTEAGIPNQGVSIKPYLCSFL